MAVLRAILFQKNCSAPARGVFSPFSQRLFSQGATREGRLVVRRWRVWWLRVYATRAVFMAKSLPASLKGGESGDEAVQVASGRRRNAGR